MKDKYEKIAKESRKTNRSQADHADALMNAYKAANGGSLKGFLASVHDALGYNDK